MQNDYDTIFNARLKKRMNDKEIENVKRFINEAYDLENEDITKECEEVRDENELNEVNEPNEVNESDVADESKEADEVSGDNKENEVFEVSDINEIREEAPYYSSTELSSVKKNYKCLELRRAYLWLSAVSGMQLNRITQLLTYFESPVDVFYAQKSDILQVLPQRQTDILLSNRSVKLIESYERKLENCGAKYIAICDPEYPDILKTIYDPPIVLFYKGDISLLKSENTLGVVGARAMSFYGKEITDIFVSKIAASGITIISGLAAGVDVEAHKAAIKTEGGKTVGVLGCGIDICYPKENYLVYEDMCKNHLVISENGPGIEPMAYLFPLRNRIISGLSKGVLVIEARKKSGSLITADSSLEQGRNVYAIPGKLTDKLSEGTNNLIKMGAFLVTGPNDIISDYKKTYLDEDDSCSYIEPLDSIGNNERRLLSMLSLEPMYVDDIICEAHLTVSEGIAALLYLSNAGLIKEVYKGFYIRNAKK